ncbi:MAG: hypothetical protein IJI03_04790, partial [Rudaea sp.]|nr:hypothetical protein [Rudaea sp.]
MPASSAGPFHRSEVGLFPAEFGRRKKRNQCTRDFDRRTMQQNLVLAPIEKLLPIRNNPFGQQKARSNAGFRRKCTIFQRGIPQKGISSSSKLS